MSKQALFRICRQTAAALCTIISLNLALFPIQPAHALEKATLQLKWLHHYQFAGYYTALERGFYREAGLDVTILEGNPHLEVEKRVAEGKADCPPGFDLVPVVFALKTKEKHWFLIGTTLLSIAGIATPARMAAKFRRLNRQLSAEIRERVQTEIALIESESKYASFFDLMPDIIGISRRSDGTFIEVNNGFVTGTGWTKEEAIGRSSLELGLWDRETRARALEIVAANGHLANFEFILTQKSGAKRYALMYMMPIVLDGTEYIYFDSHDITERKLVEEALRQSEAFLKESQQAGMIGSYSFDVRSGAWTSNEILNEIFGIDESYQRDLEGWISLIDPDQRKELREYLASHVLQHKLPFDREYRIRRRRDGEIRWVHGRGRLYFDDNGNPERMVGIIQDITERKLMEEERARLELQLLQTQKLESLGVLAGGIAHDFNNILTAIMGNLSYATMDLDPSHPAFPPLERAEKATKNAAALAKQLLVFAKGGEPVKKVVSLRHIVDDAVSLTLSGTNVRGVIDLSTDLRAVRADEGQLNQSFHNIIINAVHAMPAGGRLTVTGENVTLTENNNHDLPAGDYVKISFADEGCGIDGENLKKIFDPYFTTKTEGTGLGLASTYSIIRKHDGQITVDSVPGRGTTITIILPSLNDPLAEQAEKERPTLDRHGNDSILVMDDDEMVRELAVLTLQRFGYNVATCMNGTEAISLYRAAREAGAPFSLVVMDLTIPGGMGGIEAARQILVFDPGAHLIVSSGYSDDPVMANFTEYGFCASIEKPYKVEDISRILLQVKNGATADCR